VIHKKPAFEINEKYISNPVDGQELPVPPFGVVLEWEQCIFSIKKAP
jgi:extradiol dioxygenase family protein